MQNKVAAFVLTLSILCLVPPACEREEPSSPAAGPKSPPAQSRPSTHILPSGRVVSERLLARVDPSWIPHSLTVSPDSRRVAYVAQAGDKWFVVVNGQLQKKYDAIGVDTVAFSPDSKRVAYAARTGDKWFLVLNGKEGKEYEGILKGSFTFSPDSKRVAFAAGAGNKVLVVVDAEEGEKHDGIGRGSLAFSPDSKRVAYAAQVGENGDVRPGFYRLRAWSRSRNEYWRRFAVVDGKHGKQYDGILEGTPVFSPDSARVAYAARVGLYREEDKEWWHMGPPSMLFTPPMYVPGYGEKEGKALRDARATNLTGSTKRQDFELGNKWLLVVDGKEGKQHHAIEPGTVTFSPDSRRVAYVAHQVGGPAWRDLNNFVLVNGEEGKKYARIHSVTFSPDGERLAYAAQLGSRALTADEAREQRWLVVANGKEENKKCRSIAPGTLVFSPDGKRLAYGAQVGSVFWVVVADGKEGKRFYRPSSLPGSCISAPIFSPDSKRLAYAILAARHVSAMALLKYGIVVVDGKQHEHGRVMEHTITFSPDSRHLAYAARVSRNKEAVVVDGKEGNQYDSLLAEFGGRIVFDSPDRLHYLAQKGNEIYLIEETLN